MKTVKKTLILCFLFVLNSGRNLHAQINIPHACDSVMQLYESALVVLDSTVGNQIGLQRKLDSTQQEVSKLKTELNKLLKGKNESAAELDKAKKLIGDLMAQVKKLEGEVKRLSSTTKPEKQ